MAGLEADLFFSISHGGVAWSTPLRITNANPVVRISCVLRERGSGMVDHWLSTGWARRACSSSLRSPICIPQAAAEPDRPGYSHRVGDTHAARLSRVWVRGGRLAGHLPVLQALGGRAGIACSARTSAAARRPLSTAPFMKPCHLMLVCSPANNTRPNGRASQSRSAGSNAGSKTA